MPGRRASVIQLQAASGQIPAHKPERKWNRKGKIGDLDVSVISGASGEGRDLFVNSEIKESEVHKRMTALTREVARSEHKLELFLAENLQKTKEALVAREWKADATSRIEEERARALRLNTEVKEQFSLEVDNRQHEQSVAKASLLYAKKQVSLGVPDWFKTIEDLISIVKASGHSNKLKWRSKSCAMLKRCITETVDDDLAEQTRISLRDIVLKINHYSASELITELGRVKDAYVEMAGGGGTKFGMDSLLMQQSEQDVDRTSVVPLLRTDWSAKLDDADLSRQSLALHSTDSWSTLSRPATLSGSQISDMFEGDPRKLYQGINTAGVTRNLNTTNAEAKGLTINHNETNTGALPPPPIKAIPETALKGGIKGGNYVLHPASMNAEQAQGITRMRQAAAMGNFELCRSLFKANFDNAVKVRKGKLSVGKNAPTIEIFRILMMSFKNNPAEIRFEDAFETIDLVEEYGMVPDTPMYNVLLDCCRHSLEAPGQIYDTLRLEGLPNEFCYKAALCNCGNRMPLQVLQEVQHEIHEAGGPTDGRFERSLAREKRNNNMSISTSMTMVGVGASTDGAVEGGSHPIAARMTRNQDGSMAWRPSGRVHTPLYLFDPPKPQALSPSHITHQQRDNKRNKGSPTARMGGAYLEENSTIASVGGVGYVGEGQRELVGDRVKVDADGREYVGGLGLKGTGNLNVYADEHRHAHTHMGTISQLSASASIGHLYDITSAASIAQSQKEQWEKKVSDKYLMEKDKEYKWEQLQTKAKSLLPANSKAIKGDFGKPSRPLANQLSRLLPRERDEYYEMHEKSHRPPLGEPLSDVNTVNYSQKMIDESISYHQLTMSINTGTGTGVNTNTNTNTVAGNTSEASLLKSAIKADSHYNHKSNSATKTATAMQTATQAAGGNGTSDKCRDRDIDRDKSSASTTAGGNGSGSRFSTDNNDNDNDNRSEVSMVSMVDTLDNTEGVGITGTKQGAKQEEEFQPYKRPEVNKSALAQQGSINFQRAHNKKVEEARSRAVTFSSQLERGQTKLQTQLQSQSNTNTNSIGRGILPTSVPMYDPRNTFDAHADDRSLQSEYTRSNTTTDADNFNVNVNSSSAGGSDSRGVAHSQPSWVSDQDQAQDDESLYLNLNLTSAHGVSNSIANDSLAGNSDHNSLNSLHENTYASASKLYPLPHFSSGYSGVGGVGGEDVDAADKEPSALARWREERLVEDEESALLYHARQGVNSDTKYVHSYFSVSEAQSQPQSQSQLLLESEVEGPGEGVLGTQTQQVVHRRPEQEDASTMWDPRTQTRVRKPKPSALGYDREADKRDKARRREKRHLAMERTAKESLGVSGLARGESTTSGISVSGLARDESAVNGDNVSMGERSLQSIRSTGSVSSAQMDLPITLSRMGTSQSHAGDSHYNHDNVSNINKEHEYHPVEEPGRTKFKYRTHQTVQKVLQKLPRSDEIMPAVLKNTEVGMGHISILKGSADQHKAIVALK